MGMLLLIRHMPTDIRKKFDFIELFLLKISLEQRRKFRFSEKGKGGKTMENKRTTKGYYIIGFDGAHCSEDMHRDFFDHKEEWEAVTHNKSELDGNPVVYYAFATKEKRDLFFQKYKEAFDGAEKLTLPSCPIRHTHGQLYPAEEAAIIEWIIRHHVLPYRE